VNRKTLLQIYAAIIIGLCLYVPWAIQGIHPTRGTYHIIQGYSFVWSAPNEYSTVDMTRIILPGIAATAAFVLAWNKVKQ